MDNEIRQQMARRHATVNEPLTFTQRIERQMIFWRAEFPTRIIIASLPRTFCVTGWRKHIWGQWPILKNKHERKTP